MCKLARSIKLAYIRYRVRTTDKQKEAIKDLIATLATAVLILLSIVIFNKKNPRELMPKQKIINITEDSSTELDKTIEMLQNLNNI